MNLSELLDRLASLLYPQTCVLCGKVVEYDDLACGRCPLPLVGEDCCETCGRPLEGCVCAGEHWFFERAAAAFWYEGGVRDALLRLKTQPDKRVVRFFSRGMVEVWRGKLDCRPFNLVTEVPSRPKRLRELGYNQAELLAAALSQQMGVRHQRGVLGREGDSVDQAALNRRERMANAWKSYHIARPDWAKGQAVLLVDDIFTTGATANACSNALLEAGATSVYVLTAASTKWEKGQ